MGKMYPKILLTIFIIFSHFCYAQNDSNWNLDIGYSGGIIVHPGINMGALKTFRKSEKQRKNGKTIHKENQLGARSGFYYHRNYQTGLWFQGEMAHLRYKSDRRYHTFALGLGVLQTWVPKVYSINSQNEVSFKRAKGISYGIVSPSIEWGWNFRKKDRTFRGWYIRPRLQWQFPYFQGTNQYLLFEFGLHLN